MKIVIVGSDKIYAIENFYVKYLREAGAYVSLFTAQNIFYDYYQKSILNKLIFRAGLSGIIDKINNLLKIRITEENPDVIWVFKGMEILPNTLQWAKDRGIKLVNYNPDNPFIFSGKGSGNSNVTKSIPLYDLHFTYNESVRKRLMRPFNSVALLLPFGFDIPDDWLKECEAERELQEVCFLGNPDKGRADFIRRLVSLNISIAVYGHYWKQFIDHPSVRIHDAVYAKDLWKVLRKYRVQLNLMRVHNPDSHNMRTFEVPGVGGIMVAPDTREHRQFFEHGKEAFFFKDVYECAFIIKKVLALSNEQAMHVRQAARFRSVESGYTYRDRANTVFQAFKNLVHE